MHEDLKTVNIETVVKSVFSYAVNIILLSVKQRHFHQQKVVRHLHKGVSP